MSVGLSNQGFDIDLRNGGLREDAFANVLFRATVEVKSDRKARETGNLFIEYRQKGTPSGIAISQASFWAIEFADDCWVVLPTDVLKAICRRIARDKNRRVRGGDYDQYEGVLVKLTDLVQIVSSAELVA